MPKLQITLPDGGEILHELHEDSVTIGRLPDNGLPIEDASVSSHHARIDHVGGEWKLVDLDSTNGTFLNGAQITEETLSGGAQIRFGKVDASFIGDEEASEGSKQAMPEAGSAEVTLGTASARPAGFTSASPFPKVVKSGDSLGIAAIAVGVLGVLGAGVAIVLSLGLSAP